jgi:hypothetical protein
LRAAKKTDEAQTQTQEQTSAPESKGTIPMFTMENVDGTTFNPPTTRAK